MVVEERKQNGEGFQIVLKLAQERHSPYHLVLEMLTTFVLNQQLCLLEGVDWSHNGQMILHP